MSDPFDHCPEGKVCVANTTGCLPGKCFYRKRPTIVELEALLNSEDDTPVTINSDGSISAISIIGKAGFKQPLTPTTEIAERLTEYWKAARDSRSVTVILPIALTHGAITALRDAEMEKVKASEWARMQTTRMERAEQKVAIYESRILAATVAACNCDTKTHEPDAHDAKCTYRVLMGLLDVVE